ncbi:hypothetical protein [Tissierella sp.]|uniref:hypothetical protein n=1 Tax=Tissierella sp. TaxID=41274 RepID=UPI0028AB2FAA|nr:hypothetical protein [Tissierella sp.]
MALIIGLVSSISDIKYGKVYNKNLVFIIAISFPIVVLNFLRYDSILRTGYLVNLAICILLALLLYKYRIWAAGDAKLICTIIFLLPYDATNFFSLVKYHGIYLFSLTFGLAYVYVIFDSIYHSLRNIEVISNRFKIMVITKNKIGLFLVKWIFGVTLGNFTFMMMTKLFLALGLPNYIIYIIVFFVVSGVYSFIENSKHKYIIYLVSGILLFIWVFFSDGFNLLAGIYVNSFIIVILVMVIKFFTDIFNYEGIKVESLKRGMVLSFESCLVLNLFGLSIFTDETTRSRLNEEETKRIIECATRRSISMIKIVRLMPFSIFIFLGMILYLIIGRI